jgi:hypothetical protein
MIREIRRCWQQRMLATTATEPATSLQLPTTGVVKAHMPPSPSPESIGPAWPLQGSALKAPTWSDQDRYRLTRKGPQLPTSPA